ncbi:MAG TPA: DEAD/DEAH box helicase family protein [Solirubrobacteraceae bacterium]|nr:DEAD/DEAH box helicase family protein [Solirubrobacteraceae bacterium]
MRQLRRHAMATPAMTACARGWHRLRMRVRRQVWPPTLQFLGVVVVFLAAIGFGLTYIVGSPWWHDSNTLCSTSDLGCGLAIHLLGTGIVALIAFYVFFLGRETYTAFWWRRRAKKRPEALFSRLPPSGGLTGLAARKPMERRKRPVPIRRRPDSVHDLRFGSARSIADNIVSRKQLVKEIADDLDAGAHTQVLVGRTGSGKTMVLLKLVQHLAKRGQVPIAISLRDSSDLDFEEQAWKSYRRAFPKHTEEEVDKHWRWHRRGGLIVILVDDLEKAKAKPRAVIEALDATARAGLRVVAASRPSGVPAEFKQGRIDLEPLDKQEVSDALLDRVKLSSNDGHDESLVKGVIETVVNDAEIPKTPYYLAISRVLADTGTLPQLDVTTTVDTRLVLLDAYREDLRSGRSRADSGLDEATRASALEGLEAVALVSLGKPSKVEDLGTAVRDLLELDLDTRLTVEYGQRLGVLESRYDDVVRFGHPTTLAYFASCYLVKRKDDRGLWERALTAADLGSAAGLAFVFANAAAGDPEIARSTSIQLLDRLDEATSGNNGASELANPNERLQILNTAEEIARRNGAWSGGLAERILDRARKERDLGAIPREQIRLIEELGSIHSQRAYETLWGYATGAPDYSVRRRAMRVLLEGGGDAVKSALGQVEQVMQKAKAFRQTHALPVNDDRGAPFDDLRAVAWVLPSLRTVCRGTAASCALDEYQLRLREHAEQMTTQSGMESSIADGLKQDAMRDPGKPVDEFALEMLDPGKRPAIFWFTRVLLVQAVARRCLGRDDCQSARELVSATRNDPHPFVRAAARLCTRALRRGRWEPYIWVDMTEVAAGTSSPLVPEARQLIGEIVLALNMNEHAPGDVRTQFGSATALPACLEFSPNRAEILGLAAPRSECPFLRGDSCLCPYTYHPPEAGIRRELSRAFCRDQRLNATRLPHSDIRVKQLQDFWREMEYLARF